MLLSTCIVEPWFKCKSATCMPHGCRGICLPWTTIVRWGCRICTQANGDHEECSILTHILWALSNQFYSCLSLTYLANWRNQNWNLELRSSQRWSFIGCLLQSEAELEPISLDVSSTFVTSSLVLVSVFRWFPHRCGLVDSELSSRFIFVCHVPHFRLSEERPSWAEYPTLFDSGRFTTPDPSTSRLCKKAAYSAFQVLEKYDWHEPWVIHGPSCPPHY